MAILILTEADKNEPEIFKWFFDKWKKALNELDPNIEVRVWPNVGDPKDILLILAWRYPYGELNNYPNLKCITSIGAGVDHIMEDPKRPENIPVARIIDKNLERDMTQYVVASTLNYIKRFDHWADNQRKQLWKKDLPINFSSSQVGVMGLGFLGKNLAKALNQLGLHVSGWSHRKKNIEHVQCFEGKDLQAFLSQANILICLLPLTPDTKNILNKQTLHYLPQGAFLINVARGNLLVDEHLLEALDSGQLSGACLDVFREEPLPKDHPFWNHPKIKITPHIASVTNPRSAASQIIENYHRILQGQELINTIDIKRGY